MAAAPEVSISSAAKLVKIILGAQHEYGMTVSVVVLLISIHSFNGSGGPIRVDPWNLC